MKGRNHRSIAIGAAALGSALFSQPIAKGVTATLEMHYYDVTGRSWAEVWANILANRRVLATTHERFEGVTTFDVKLQADPGSGRCAADTVSLAIPITITLPRLSSQATLAHGDRACWAYYDRSLTDHEEGHVQLAIQDGEALLATLRGMQGASCNDLQATVRARAADMKDSQDSYDAVTQHGIAQWRRFAPYGAANPAANEQFRQRCIK
jgi:predicted secreted Zn-dependent protease